MKALLKDLEVVALLAIAAGCASVPPASKEARDQALSFKPLPQCANVYVFRPKDPLEGEGLIQVSLDHILVGELGNESYLCLPIAPGNHKISRRFAPFWCAAKFTAEAGKNYFFLDSYNLLRGDKTRAISETEGKAYAEKFTLSSHCGAQWAMQFSATQGGQPFFIYDIILPASTGAFASPSALHYWALSGIGNIQAQLSNGLGRR